MTDEAEELLKKLEPEIADRHARVLIRHHGDSIMLASIAISMKRIADSLNDIVRYGVTTND